jgi:hypothetical protein
MSTLMSSILRAFRQSPLAYGCLFALLPLGLGLAVGPLVGFGPCGPSVASSVRLVVVAAGTLAIASPIIGCWLFWISFRTRKTLTAVVALPLLGASVFVCLYWLIVLISAVMS